MTVHHRGVSRRHTLQSLAASAAVVGMAVPASAQPSATTTPPATTTPASAAPAPSAPALPEMPRPAFPRPTLHVYDTYAWLRGFNCIPSWGARIEDAWWFYDATKMREELALARSVHANAICLWIEFTAWFLVNECVPGSDVDEIRGEMHRLYRELLSAAGHGTMAWSIREGKSIAARRDRMDRNGINHKGYHPTFNADGTLRRGHEWMREKPKLAAPWEAG